jgi:hypothetical protein
MKRLSPRGGVPVSINGRTPARVGLSGGGGAGAILPLYPRVNSSSVATAVSSSNSVL